MTTALPRFVIIAALSFVAVFTLPASAAVPDGINYQAFLTNADGTPVNGSVAITFHAYNVDIGGVPLWSQSGSVIVDRGLFSVTLGNPGNPFPAGMFNGPVYVGLVVAGEEMLPRRQLTTAAYAFLASDADTLDGVQAADLDQSADIASVQTIVTELQTTTGSNDTRIEALAVSGPLRGSFGA